MTRPADATLLLFAIILFLLQGALQAAQQRQEIEILEGEGFWGGCVTDGRFMPFGRESFARDLYGDTRGNQTHPLLISDRGRYVWSEEPFAFSFRGRTLEITSSHAEIKVGRNGNTLREALQYVSRTFFPSNGQIPDELLFANPQYNTWIELIYDQKEDRIRQYARDIVGHGFPTGVLMIDDNWQDLRQLIPDALALGLMGYAYICPDMIGGGESRTRSPANTKKTATTGTWQCGR